MTTIILTIIGILLAAAAALMVIFYGGDAFNSGTIGAQANQIQNAGTNVVSAVQMFKAERATDPTSFGAGLTTPISGLAALTTSGANGAYLDEQPALPQNMTANLVRQGARDLYVISGTGLTDQVCARINSNLRVTPPAGGADVAAAQAAAAAVAAPKMGCYDTTGAGNVFIARA